MKYNCAIIKDLLPLYIDHVCSKESSEIIEEHLKECTYCQKYLEDLNEAKIIEDKYYDENNEKRKSMAIKMINKNFNKKKLLAIFLTLIITLLIGTVVYKNLKSSLVVISDTSQMSVSNKNDLVLNVENYIIDEATSYIFTLQENNEEITCIVANLKTSKLNKLFNFQNVTSTHVLCYQNSTTDIKRVYYCDDLNEIDNLDDYILTPEELITKNYTLIYQK